MGGFARAPEIIFRRFKCINKVDIYVHRVTVCGLSSGLGMQHIETESSRHNKPSAPSNLLIYLERHLPGALFPAKAQCKGLDGVVATGEGGQQ